MCTSFGNDKLQNQKIILDCVWMNYLIDEEQKTRSNIKSDKMIGDLQDQCYGQRRFSMFLKNYFCSCNSASIMTTIRNTITPVKPTTPPCRPSLKHTRITWIYTLRAVFNKVHRERSDNTIISQ